MAAVKIELFPEEDIARIDVGQGTVSHVQFLDDSRRLAYGAGGELLWVYLLYASEGMNLAMLPPEQREEAAGELQQHGIRTSA